MATKQPRTKLEVVLNDLPIKPKFFIVEDTDRGECLHINTIEELTKTIETNFGLDYLEHLRMYPIYSSLTVEVSGFKFFEEK